MSKVRIFNVETGETSFSSPAFAYSMVALENRWVTIGDTQTHIFCRCRTTGRPLAVPIGKYSGRKHQHPIDYMKRKRTETV